MVLNYLQQFCKDEGHDVQLEEMKECKKCKQLLPDSKFPWHGGSNYRRTECDDCNRKLEKVRRNLKKIHPYPDEKTYKCPICNRGAEEVKGEGGKRQKKCFALDHDHITEQFRAYLCHRCNRSLGGFEDEVELIERAKQYLINTGKQTV